MAFQRTKGLSCGKYIPSLIVIQLIRHLDLGAIPTVGSFGPPLRTGGDRYIDLCFPGCYSMSGPRAVNGRKGGSLSVQCGYNPGWETYYKWWCRGADWGSCQILVKTTGSEQEVKKDRVSIRDSQKNRTFKVTMEKLREDDAGFYRCGIERFGSDLGVPVKVSIGPAPATPEENTTSPIMTSWLSDVSCWDIFRAGPLAKGGDFLCFSVFGHLESGAILQQHGLDHGPHSRGEPRGAHRIQLHQKPLAATPGLPLGLHLSLPWCAHSCLVCLLTPVPSPGPMGD
ncbi:CMRF35-like molecule 1 isoform X6 [Trichechus manatus latirostris]|uniref:CMRF35-like molecule 1 isoform X6 n=1 Tax=Trichechus manatus latirostris TaxID=127582 RepID=A0A2Y9R0A4_TRIMA|nr:CMRF35-like molecule 1 isoform X6 [Trichechus manatus latirostris]